MPAPPVRISAEQPHTAGGTRVLPRVLRPFAELLFPPACWVTGQAITLEDAGLAPQVRLQIAAEMAGPYCRRCGATLGAYTMGDAANPCGRCAVRDLGVQSIARVGAFEPPLSNLILRMKFQKRFEIAAVCAPFLAAALAEASVPVDLLVPVPLHAWRRLRRGFNQSEELAQQTARLLRCPVVHGLHRQRRTSAQALTDSAASRRTNLRGAFLAIADKKLAGRNVWLLDDVCTTGATLHAAATALLRLPRDLRPASVHAVVLCVTDYQPQPLS